MAESRPGDRDRWINETLAAMLDGPPERVFYLLICRECGNGDLVMPFSSPAGRGKWAAGHTAGTGHQRWFVTESTTRLSPEQVTEMLARHDETVRWWRSD
jgi:hypothetical protein